MESGGPHICPSLSAPSTTLIPKQQLWSLSLGQWDVVPSHPQPNPYPLFTTHEVGPLHPLLADHADSWA